MFRRYGLALLALAILSPLGLLTEGTAWGEWDADSLKEMLGYVPQGMEQVGDLWKAIFPDYSMNFLGESTIGHYVGYIFSAIIGAAIIYFVMILLARILIQHKNKPICQDK